MANIRPTVPRYGWEVKIAVVPAKLKDTLNEMSEKGWTRDVYLKSRQIGCWDVVFYRLEHIGKRDAVDALVEDNPLPPFQGAVRVND